MFRSFRKMLPLLAAASVCFFMSQTSLSAAAPAESAARDNFPPPLQSYGAQPDASLLEVLVHRVKAEPFNLFATLLFLGAIAHTFLAPTFMKLAHHYDAAHRERLKREGRTLASKPYADAREDVSFRAEMLHFLGEVEAVFGIWGIPLLFSLALTKGWGAALDYSNYDVNFTEPMFVVVVMTIAASRPILKFAEQAMAFVARLGNNSAMAWWLSILTLGPVLGSFITEPAAMTISAMLLSRKIYERKPSLAFSYATLGLLFVNISVGGTLTHFAAPPVLMVAEKWNWDIAHMFTQFGWKAILGILLANLLYAIYFRRDLNKLGPVESFGGNAVLLWEHRPDPVPKWITAVHLAFLAWVIVNNHYPVFFIGGFLFYLAFTRATDHHQNELRLRPALLVGFFLAGLVLHGNLQGWWIEPVLTRLGDLPLFGGSVVLTAFNDNAAITYLASLVPDFSDNMKYAVVAGAVTGGGLTIIANAPNPAGQSILSRFFPEGVSPTKLLLGALVPTLVMAAAFLCLP